MGRPHALATGLLILLVALGWLLFRRGLDPDRRQIGLESDTSAAAERGGTFGGPAGVAPDTRRPGDDVVLADDVVYQPEDLEIFRETVRWALEQRLDTAGIGTIIVGIGRRFVGEPYLPNPLELPGEERLVVNLREFDCVTYVENVLAMARVIRSGNPEFPAFTDELRRIRYREGRLDGYLSRLHYFSEWIADNERLGLVRDVTPELGGRADPEPIGFMSANADAYAPLREDPARVERIRDIERRISAEPRHVIPQDGIGAVADRIRDGDIIAATSSVGGLDIAHTGFAVRVDGRLHLMHAPLVGRSLEISERPLAERILRIDGQDGVMVARPL